MADKPADTAPKAKPAKTSKKALYHTSYAPSVEVFVVAENADGTVDLSRDGESVMVKKCPVAEAAKDGHCTLGTEAPKAAEAEQEFEDLDKP